MIATHQSINPASSLAQSLTNRSYVSWSQVQCYQQCPQKFELQYVQRVKPKFTPSALAFGGALHVALASHFDDLLIGGPGLSLDELLIAYSHGFRDQDTPILFNKKEDESVLSNQAERMLSAFLASPVSKAEGILCVEDEFTATLREGLPDLLARLDLVQKTPAGLVITDFKTSKASWDADKLLEHGGQLLLYAKLAAPRLGAMNLPMFLQMVVVTKHKTPRVQVHPIEHSNQAVENTLTLIQEVWQGITAGVFPARPGWMCKSCPYRGHCPAMNTGGGKE